ncbi:hypothetical protein GW17_00023121 [Ensete ventricosum]|nr:hypothetical protein GW17_00023121 [Ensete ventricosum]
MSIARIAEQTDGARPLPHRPKPYGSAPHNIGLDESACAVGSVRVNDLRDHIKLGIDGWVHLDPNSEVLLAPIQQPRTLTSRASTSLAYTCSHAPWPNRLVATTPRCPFVNQGTPNCSTR